jgi:hypothetical protein
MALEPFVAGSGAVHSLTRGSFTRAGGGLQCWQSFFWRNASTRGISILPARSEYVSEHREFSWS